MLYRMAQHDSAPSCLAITTLFVKHNSAVWVEKTLCAVIHVVHTAMECHERLGSGAITRWPATHRLPWAVRARRVLDGKRPRRSRSVLGACGHHCSHTAGLSRGVLWPTAVACHARTAHDAKQEPLAIGRRNDNPRIVCPHRHSHTPLVPRPSGRVCNNMVDVRIGSPATELAPVGKLGHVPVEGACGTVSCNRHAPGRRSARSDVRSVRGDVNRCAAAATCVSHQLCGFR